MRLKPYLSTRASNISASHARWLIASTLLLACSSSFAQTTPNLPDPAAEQRRQIERENAIRQQLEQTRPSPPEVKDTPLLERLPFDEKPCFTITKVVLNGELSDKFSWLIEAPVSTTPYVQTHAPIEGPNGDDSPIGRCLGTQGIDLVLRRLQNALIAKGFVTTRVLAPTQDLKTGILTLTIIPGRIHAIRMAPDNSYTSLWNALPFAVGDILNLRDIEQAIDNFKRNPTVEADIKITPSGAVSPTNPANKETNNAANNAATNSSANTSLLDKANTARPGDSDLIISFKQAFPIRLNLGLDDSGSKSTGKQIANASISVDNLLRQNDLFYVSATRSIGHALSDITTGAPGSIFGGTAPGDRGNSSETVHYEIPYGYWLLGATASQNRYHQEIVGANQNYQYSGFGSNVEAKLSRLIYRDANNKTNISIKGFRRSNHSYIDDAEITVQKRIEAGWELGFNHRLLFKTKLDPSNQASLDLNLNYKQGTGAFGALTAPEDAFGEGTSRFKITTGDITLNLPFTVSTQRLFYTTTVRGQYNGAPFHSAINLTPIDQFAIGGRYSVRGFSGENSLVGNNGVTWRNEVSWSLDGVGLKGQNFYTGVDAGWIGGNLVNQPPIGHWLAGAVIGFRGSFGTWGLPAAQYRSVQYDIFLGAPLYKPNNFQATRLTGGFSLAASF